MTIPASVVCDRVSCLTEPDKTGNGLWLLGF